ncbi:MAG: DUF423 domain-containing protein [Rhodospirillaceae bacterium]
MGRWLIWAGLNGLIAVAAGAFAAHALQATLEPKALGWIETASRYELAHALALLWVAVLARDDVSPWIARAGWLFAAGTVLFCGSLYALAFTGMRPFAWVTPLGGLAFLAGWAALIAAGLAAKRR